MNHTDENNIDIIIEEKRKLKNIKKRNEYHSHIVSIPVFMMLCLVATFILEPSVPIIIFSVILILITGPEFKFYFIMEKYEKEAEQLLRKLEDKKITIENYASEITKIYIKIPRR